MATKQKVRGKAFGALSDRVQKWVGKKRWTDLRPIQRKVIPVLLDELREPSGLDFVISAPTASGKTEAVFMPVSTVLDEAKEPAGGAEVLYICPLVALIDQQANRLSDGLIDTERYAVTPWHGRANTAGKRRFESTPGGVLVITPESLESMFINRSGLLQTFFGALRCIVIDEFHAFFNNPRGVQLLAQLNRVDMIADRKVPRLALSATFNQQTEKEVREHLRPNAAASVRFLLDDEWKHKLEYSLRGYADPGDPTDMKADARGEAIARQVYADFRNLYATGKRGEKAKGLIFVNSRKEAERFAHRLCELAAEGNGDVEFYPHHGSLAPEERHRAEEAIRDKDKRAVIVCTPTLELGIDIGMITQVGQIDPGSSVSALHQRLGRSGRRHGQIGRLIMYVRDARPRARSSPLTELHLPTFQALAQISLVQEKAYEPPDRRAAHLSTLIQQILSLAAQQNGSVTMKEVQETLIENGPFYALRKAADKDGHLILLFARLLQADLLERTDADYRLTVTARRMMDDHRFYAAFQSGDDYRVQTGEGEMLGTVPTAHLYAVGDRIIYARRTWTITSISRAMKVIRVAPSATGQAPLFSGSPIPPSQAVVSRMKKLYDGTIKKPRKVKLDEEAQKLYAEGIAEYDTLGLRTRSIIPYGTGVLLLPWLAYRGQLSLLLALRHWGASVTTASIAIFVERMAMPEIERLLRDLADGTKIPPAPDEAMRSASSVLIDKHDRLLSPYLQRWNAATFRVEMETVPESARMLLGAPGGRSAGTPRRRPSRR
ncbi:MAG TPA: DEAD/DEAH box helicase [Thermoanaerobaculia bacterium]|jgi:ATP-dependent Lhr-like helicase|nr:DEAD/DEAH box helicase [Thermoanaerobaculia bacterium]